MLGQSTEYTLLLAPSPFLAPVGITVAEAAFGLTDNLANPVFGVNPRGPFKVAVLAVRQ